MYYYVSMSDNPSCWDLAMTILSYILYDIMD
jgi:hypothetical protein